MEDVLLFFVPIRSLIFDTFLCCIGLFIFTYFLLNPSFLMVLSVLSTLLCIIFMKEDSARFVYDTPVPGTRPLGPLCSNTSFG